MKYGKVRSYADVLGFDLAKNVPLEIVKNRIVIYPPMKLLDKFLRGFNQAEIIAEKVALKHGLKLDMKVLKKTRRTKPQASLTFENRQKNLKDAFSLTRDVTKESFLIVDDVTTTMSTINTIAELLKKNGAKSVNAVTVARTSPYFS
jgi:predicted amidophosphoribosyltransferase